MTGPKNADDVLGLNSTPKIFLSSGKTNCHLIAYRALNATYCLLLNGTYSYKSIFLMH